MERWYRYDWWTPSFLCSRSSPPGPQLFLGRVRPPPPPWSCGALSAPAAYSVCMLKRQDEYFFYHNPPTMFCLLFPWGVWGNESHQLPVIEGARFIIFSGGVYLVVEKTQEKSNSDFFFGFFLKNRCFVAYRQNLSGIWEGITQKYS